MKLSFESIRTRWLLLVGIWVICAGLVFDHAQIVHDYLEITGQLGLRGAQRAGTPLEQAFPAGFGALARDLRRW